MFHTAVYFSFIIFIFSIQNQHACEVTDQTYSFKNGQGEAAITLNCDYKCNNINTYLELFNFRLRENQIKNFEETIEKAKQTKSDFVISENFKAITFFNTTWKECYQRHSHLKTFLTSIYLQNLTDFTGYFIKNPKIDSKPTLGGYFLEPTVFGEEGSPLLISNREIIIVFHFFYWALQIFANNRHSCVSLAPNLTLPMKLRAASLQRFSSSLIPKGVFHSLKYYH